MCSLKVTVPWIVLLMCYCFSECFQASWLMGISKGVSHPIAVFLSVKLVDSFRVCRVKQRALFTNVQLWCKKVTEWSRASFWLRDTSPCYTVKELGIQGGSTKHWNSFKNPLHFARCLLGLWYCKIGSLNLILPNILKIKMKANEPKKLYTNLY